MVGKFKYLLGNTATRPVFVIGTGRSGTHWLGYSLRDHPEVRATIESSPMFGLSTKMALDPSLEARLFRILVLAYKWQLFKTEPLIYLDKSHPNIWIADKLKAAFPKSLFVGIERNPYATVASMMKHKGVSAWHKRWKKYPIPNRFLGISTELASTYDDIPFASQCAMRWVAHHNKMNELKNILGNDLFTISYEDFAHNTEKVIHDLQDFLGFNQPIPVPEVKIDSLHKWREQLSNQEISQIQDIVGFPPDKINH